MALHTLKRFQQDAERLGDDPSAEGWFRILNHPDEVDAMADYYLDHCKRPLLSLDIEAKNTTITKGHQKIVTLQFCADGWNGYVVPLDHAESPWADASDPKTRRRVLKTLKRLFYRPEPTFKRWVEHFAQFEDSQTYNHLGFRPINRPQWCTKHLTHLGDENRLVFTDDRKGVYTLKRLVAEYFGFNHYEADDLEARRAGMLYKLAMDRLARYGCMDVWVTVRLALYVLDRMKAEGYLENAVRIMDEILSPTVHLEAALKRNGFPVNLDHCKYLMSRSGPVAGRMADVQREILALPEVQQVNDRLAGTLQKKTGLRSKFGGGSQLYEVKKARHKGMLFFDVLDLEPRQLKPDEVKAGKLSEYDPELAEKTGKTPPMDKGFLSLYASVWTKDGWIGNVDESQQPLYPAVTKYSELAGLKTLNSLFVRKIWYEYVRPTEPALDCRDGRTHSTFDFAATVTGRGASYGPNGQQIPRSDTPVKKQVKNLYTAPEHKCLGPMDYKANEVRWACINSGDRVLADLLIAGYEAVEKFRRKQTDKNRSLAKIADDIHKQTAATVFGISNIYDYDWGTDQAKQLRTITKTIIFGVFYGRGAKAIAALLGISVERAKELIDKIKRRFRRLFEWLEDQISTAKRHGYVESAFGHRRRLSYLFECSKQLDKARKAGCWKDAEFAEFLGWTLSDVRNAQKDVAEGGRLAQNSSIQYDASTMNNLGAFEFLLYSEPELAHLSPLGSPFKRVEVARLGMKSATTPEQYRNALADFEAQCDRTRVDWQMHNLVHDSAVPSCRPEELGRMFKVMEKCFVTRSSEICSKVFGIDMIAPVAVEFEAGASYGSVEEWDFTDSGLDKLTAAATLAVQQRDASRKLRAAMERP